MRRLKWYEESGRVLIRHVLWNTVCGTDRSKGLLCEPAIPLDERRGGNHARINGKFDTFTGSGDNAHHLLTGRKRNYRVEGVGSPAHEDIRQTQGQSLYENADLTGAGLRN